MNEMQLNDDKFIEQIQNAIAERRRATRRTRRLYLIWLAGLAFALLYPWLLANNQHQIWVTELQRQRDSLALVMKREAVMRKIDIDDAQKNAVDQAGLKIEQARQVAQHDLERFAENELKHNSALQNLIAQLRAENVRAAASERRDADSIALALWSEVRTRAGADEFRRTVDSLRGAIAARLENSVYRSDIAALRAGLESRVDSARRRADFLHHDLGLRVDSLASAMGNGLRDAVPRHLLDTQIDMLRMEWMAKLNTFSNDSLHRRP